MTEDKRIDYGKAVELFQLAIHERGADHVYERPRGGDGCYYSDHVFESASSLTEDIIPYLKPGCAWGLALSRSHLVPLEKMAVQPGFVVAMLQDFGFEITPKAAAFMSESQSRQDAGDSWGHAVGQLGRRHAEFRLPRHLRGLAQSLSWASAQDGDGYTVAGRVFSLLYPEAQSAPVCPSP